MHLEAISAENQVYPRPSCDFSLSEEQYREEILKKSNVMFLAFSAMGILC